MYPREVIDIVKAKRLEGKTIRTIADYMNFHPSTVDKMVKTDYNRPKKKRGAKAAIAKREKTWIERACERLPKNDEKGTSKKIQNNCDLTVATWTIQRTLKKMGYNYKKAKVELVLSKAHKTARVDIVRTWIRDRVDWSMVAFSDKKHFSFDVPNNWATYAR